MVSKRNFFAFRSLCLTLFTFFSCDFIDNSKEMFRKVKFKKDINDKEVEFLTEKDGFRFHFASKVFNCNFEDRNNWMVKVIYGRPKYVNCLVNVLCSSDLELTTSQIKSMDFKVNFTLKETCKKCISANCVPKDKPCDYCSTCNRDNSALTEGLIVHNVEILVSNDILAKMQAERESQLLQERIMRGAQFKQGIIENNPATFNIIFSVIQQNWSNRGHAKLKELNDMLGINTKNIDFEHLSTAIMKYMKKEIENPNKYDGSRKYSPQNAEMTDAFLNGCISEFNNCTTPEQRVGWDGSFEELRPCIRDFIENAIEFENKKNQIFQTADNIFSDINDLTSNLGNLSYSENNFWENESDKENNYFDSRSKSDGSYDNEDNSSDYEDEVKDSPINNDFRLKSDSDVEKIVIEQQNHPKFEFKEQKEGHSVSGVVEKRILNDYEICNEKEFLLPLGIEYMPAPLYLFNDIELLVTILGNIINKIYINEHENKYYRINLDRIIYRKIDISNALKVCMKYIRMLKKDNREEVSKIFINYKIEQIQKLISYMIELKDKGYCHILCDKLAHEKDEKNKKETNSNMINELVMLNCDYDYRYNYSSEDVENFFPSILLKNKTYTTLIWINILSEIVMNQSDVIFKWISGGFNSIDENEISKIIEQNTSLLKIITEISIINYKLKDSRRHIYIADILFKAVIRDIGKRFNEIFNDHDLRVIKMKVKTLRKVLFNLTRAKYSNYMLSFANYTEPVCHINKQAINNIIFDCNRTVFY